MIIADGKILTVIEIGNFVPARGTHGSNASVADCAARQATIIYEGYLFVPGQALQIQDWMMEVWLDTKADSPPRMVYQLYRQLSQQDLCAQQISDRTMLPDSNMATGPWARHP